MQPHFSSIMNIHEYIFYYYKMNFSESNESYDVSTLMNIQKIINLINLLYFRLKHHKLKFRINFLIKCILAA